MVLLRQCQNQTLVELEVELEGKPMAPAASTQLPHRCMWWRCLGTQQRVCVMSKNTATTAAGSTQRRRASDWRQIKTRDEAYICSLRPIEASDGKLRFVMPPLSRSWRSTLWPTCFSKGTSWCKLTQMGVSGASQLRL